MARTAEKYQSALRESSPHSARRRPKDDAGVALVITLLLLTVMSVLGLAMVLTVGSDMMVNGYYRNYRGSFYAADSGLNIARQAMINQVVTSAQSGTVPVGTDPISSTVITNATSYTTSTYGSFTTLNAGQASSSWTGNFKISSATLTLTTSVPTCCDSNGKNTAYTDTYAYALTSVGNAYGTEQASINESGNIIFSVALTNAASSTNASFAAWGMFIDQYSVCSGSFLVPGTITGPVFTNGGWTFGTSGSYTFTDPVGSASTTAGYQFGSCIGYAGGSYTSGGQTISPTYQGTCPDGSKSLCLGQPAVPLPVNDYSQKWAAVNGKGIGESDSTPTNADLNAALKSISGTAYPSGGASTGVFLPYKNVSGVNTVTGGGIYVEGDAQVTLSTSGSSAQVFQIKQGSTTTTVTIDPTANTTTVVSGSTTLNLAGVPNNLSGSTPTPATMLYVDGNITGLSGTGQGVAAVQDGAAVTITAAQNVTITGDILYKTEPVTLTQNQIVSGTSPACCNGTPADTLIPGHDNNQTLGIFTATGNINLNNSQSNQNLEIDASLATISQGGSGGLVNTGAAINTLNIVGGRIQNTIQNINTTTRNVFFDRRYKSKANFAPPWFPSTTVTTTTTSDSSTVTPSVQRVKWENTSAM
jgi:Tfp pilus assembly protein PilX